MKVAVIGASGRTGHLLVEELLRRGHLVTALVRDPVRLGDLAGRVTVVTGDSRRVLRPLVAGTDAVLSALGPTRKEPALHQNSAAALIAAMREHGVRRRQARRVSCWAASDLDWTLVRPPRLKDGSATGRVEHDGHRSVRATSPGSWPTSWNRTCIPDWPPSSARLVDPSAIAHWVRWRA